MDTSTLLEELHLNNIRTTVLNKKLNIFSPATTISINPSLIQQDTRNAKHSNGVGILSEALARDKIALIAQRNSAKKQANLVKLKHYTTNYNGAKTVAKREISIGKKSLLASLTSSETDHVLNIKVSPTNREISASYHQSEGNISVVHINNSMVHSNNENGSRSVVNLNSNNSEIKIMFKNANKSNTIKMASGQCSPTTSDHLDSGTCSDVELNMPASPLPPPLPKKMNKHNQLSDSICSNSDESVSSLSSDSLSYHNNNLLSPELIKSLDNHNKKHTCIVLDNRGKKKSIGIFPSSLLKDIRDHSLKLGINDSIYYKSRTTDDEEEDNDVAYNLLKSPMLVNQVRNYESGIRCNLRTDIKNISLNRNASDHIFYEKDQFYQFHINEHLASIISEPPAKSNTSDIDESFAGLKDLNNGTSTIRSNKGTVRGVKNRVRNGIATFLQMQQSTVKSYNDKDAGKVVVYTTSMGIVRSTYTKCQSIKQILKTLLVKFEERDVFMSGEYQQEIKDRMQKTEIDIPQLFVNGQYIGNAELVEKMNETGELRKLLKPFKCFGSTITCKICGGYKLLPCPSCGGSKKSIHRNHFTTEFIALKCMNCDEVGLVKCYNC